MSKVLVILGPTAIGKTDMALFLAKKFNGELVSCDSRQVYRGLDIGSGKLPSGIWKIEVGGWKMGKGFWEVDGVRIYMYDVASPKRQYNVLRFVKDANKIIKDICNRGKFPIIVGGTGLYLKALLYGLPNLSIPIDKQLRKKLERLTKEQLQERLRKVSPSKWRNLNNSDRENPRRLIRAIELKLSPRRSPFGHLRGGLTSYDVLKVGLTAPREILYQRSDRRVLSRIRQGMIKEAETLNKDGLSLKRMRQLGLEYGALADYLEDKIKTKESLIKIMQGKIRGYLRRQLTWFKKEKNVNWFDITDQNFAREVENLIDRWYHSPDATQN